MSTLITSGPAASAKQISFVTDLLAQREVDADLAAEIQDAIGVGEYSKASASEHIEAFLKLPKRANPARASMQSLLASIPKSRYAVPTELIEFAATGDDDFPGDLVFLELKEYMNTLYVRQLRGSQGSFTRVKLSNDSVKSLVSIISEDPYKYASLYGKHYSCCGSCGAELTDQRSRELQLGPECRKKFGF